MHNLQIIIILLVVVAPILKQLYDKAQEQKELQRRRRESSVMQRETLRTGRAPDEVGSFSRTQPVDERARLQQLEADRLARIRAMREATTRGQQGAAGQRAGATPAQVAEARRAQELAARRRAALEAQQRQAQLQAQQRQAQARAQAQAQQAQARAQAQRRQTRAGQQVRSTQPEPFAKRERVATVRAEPLTPQLTARARTSAIPAARAAGVGPGSGLGGELRTAGGIRRAILMSEILRPPLALRSQADSDAAWGA